MFGHRHVLRSLGRMDPFALAVVEYLGMEVFDRVTLQEEGETVQGGCVS
jgi:hypothetical protein